MQTTYTLLPSAFEADILEGRTPSVELSHPVANRRLGHKQQERPVHVLEVLEVA